MRWRKTGENDVLSVAAAQASYQDDEFQNFARRKNNESKAIIESMCEELGIRYVKSNANFTFINTGMENRAFQERMREFGLLTGRDFPPYDKSWARISFAKPEEIEYFVEIYKRLFA